MNENLDVPEDSSNTTEESQWISEFKKISKDKGYISRADIESYWQINKNLNPTHDDVDEVLIASHCKDQEKINEDEFLRIQKRAIMHNFYTSDSRVDLEQALAVYDKNNDGTIAITELKEILSSHGDVFDDFISMTDKHGDGKVSIEDLVSLLIPGQTEAGK